MYVEVRGQLGSSQLIGSLLPHVGEFWGSNSGLHQACVCQAPSPTELSLWLLFWFALFCFVLTEVSQASPKLTGHLRMTLKSWYSCFYLLRACATDMHHHVWFLKPIILHNEYTLIKESIMYTHKGILHILKQMFESSLCDSVNELLTYLFNVAICHQNSGVWGEGWFPCALNVHGTQQVPITIEWMIEQVSERKYCLVLTVCLGHLKLL